jgi:hypothetical protein
MARLLAQERETIIRWDATSEDGVVGSNIPGDVAKLTKLWGPSEDIRGEWHSWQIPKPQVRLPRPARKRAPATEAQKAAGKRLAESRKAPK